MVITSASFAYDEGIKQHGRGNRVWTRRSADLHGFMYLWCKGGLRVVGVGVGAFAVVGGICKSLFRPKPLRNLTASLLVIWQRIDTFLQLMSQSNFKHYRHVVR